MRLAFLCFGNNESSIVLRFECPEDVQIFPDKQEWEWRGTSFKIGGARTVERPEQDAIIGVYNPKENTDLSNMVWAVQEARRSSHRVLAGPGSSDE